MYFAQGTCRHSDEFNLHVDSSIETVEETFTLWTWFQSFRPLCYLEANPEQLTKEIIISKQNKSLTPINKLNGFEYKSANSFQFIFQ